MAAARSPRWWILAVVVVSGHSICATGAEPRPAGDASVREPVWTEQQRKHWSYLPPKRTKLPDVKNRTWVRNPIDAFILREIEKVELPPAGEADRATLIRRLRFDLTGLPPTPEEVDAFVADKRPDAYERLVDALLESPQYGERWARMWLDLARYAESDGFKSDKTRPNAWRYRDWVIKALNDDMPFDRFVTLQLAGDEVAPFDPQAFIATGFNRNWPFEDNNKVPGLNRQLMLEDMTDTTASVFLGLTVACARCHDHKYDAISQKDYYRFQALFAASEPRDDFALVPPFEQSLQASVEVERKARVDVAKREIEQIERPYRAALLKPKLARLPADVQKAFATDPEERSAFQEDLLVQYAGDLTVPPAKMESSMAPADRAVWKGRGREMSQLLKEAQSGPATATGMTDSGPDAPPIHLMIKGNFANPGPEVAPGFLSVFAGAKPEAVFARFVGDRSSATGTHASSTSGRRKALAEWLTRPENPLTARVMVNRLWQNHFGRGIVATASDFGTQGTPPSHPALLDWLATELIAQGWSLKAMHRLMVTSATYRQSSLALTQTLADDPDNTLFARMPRRRLEGESVRDALLAVSGRLDRRVGGPSVFPDLPPGVETRGGWTRSALAADRNRRSIYVFARRNLKYPLFDAFDAPDSNVTCPERNVSVNAPQALMLLNSGLVMEQARGFAGRVLREASDRNDLGALVNRTYRLAFGRSPHANETRRAVAFIEEATARLSERSARPKGLELPEPLPEGHDLAQAAALVDYCHVLLNLNEFVFVD